MERKTCRARRIWAYLTDYMLSVLVMGLFALIILLPFWGILILLIAAIAVSSLFTTFLLRDYLFNGRSLGKRILGLAVVDVHTQAQPSAKQLIVKNLFLPLFLIDGLFLLFSGKSLGERASDTVVVRIRLACQASDSQAEQPAPTPVKKRIITAITIVLCFSVLFFLVTSIGLNNVKKQDNYQLAYEYLLSSTGFSETKAEESQILLTGYSLTTTVNHNSSSRSNKAIFTFLVKGQQYQVVCHQNGGVWYVCPECTVFR